MQTDGVMEHQETMPEEQPAAPEQVAQDMQQDHEQPESNEQEGTPEKMVPLSALQKERKKRQDAELHADWQLQERTRLMQQPAAPVVQEEDETLYESATRGELQKTKQETVSETVRTIKEDLWLESNPEKKAFIDENLGQFLKQKPGYARVLEVSPNRYKEAYELMNAFTPRQPAQKKRNETTNPAPHAPTSVPKSTAMNANVDVMNMSDADFNAWRKTKKTRR